MKRIILNSVLFLGAMAIHAQSISEGLNYTQEDIYGTARNRAMSGAFGSLGGDLSAMSINPAGSVIFSNNYTSFSLANYINNNEAVYFDGVTTENDWDVSLNQAGFVFIFKEGSEQSKWRKFSIGLNYENTANLDDSVYLSGTSQSTIADYFLEFANGNLLDDYQLRNDESISGLFQYLGEANGFASQQGFLGYQAEILDSTDESDPNNTSYTSNVAPGNFRQNFLQESRGYVGKFIFNSAAQFDDWLSLGMNLNSEFINYNRRTSLIETNTNGGLVNDIGFENFLEVEGVGISFQLGAIANVTKELRAGFSYESPTWYNINEFLTQQVSARGNDATRPINSVVAPNVVTIFPTYRLRTPGSITGSLSYVFGTKGLLSLDYKSSDYSNMKYGPDRDLGYAENNRQINDNFRRAGTIRIGGEYRVHRVTFRAGYHNEQSPYENEDLMGDINGFSLGLGFNWGKALLDLSYQYSQQQYSKQLYSTGLTTRGEIDQVNNTVVATLSFNL